MIFWTFDCARTAAFLFDGGVEGTSSRSLGTSTARGIGVVGVVGLACFVDGRGGVEGDVEGDVAVDFVRESKPFVFLPAGEMGDADGGGGPLGFSGFLRGERRDVVDFLRAVMEDGDGGT